MKLYRNSLFVVASILALVGAGCGRAETQPQSPAPIPTLAPIVEETPTPTPPVAQPTPTPVAPAPTPTPTPTPTPEPVATAPVTHTISMVAKQWVFEPASVTVKQGDTVILQVTSTDVDHGLLLPGYGINLDLKTGETKSVTFVASKKGTFTFSCNVFCGSGHGSMKGTLIVE